MTNSVSLENLESCKAAADAYKANAEQNAIITKYNHEQTEKYKAAYSAWQQRKRDFDDKKNRWQNKTGEYDKYKNFESNQVFDGKDTDWSRDCGHCTAACNYPPSHEWADNECKRWAGENNYIHSNEYYYNGKWRHDNTYWDGACGKKRVRFECARKPSEIDKWRAAYNADMPTFTDPEPKEKEGDYAHRTQIDNTGNIQCCANILNINIGDATNVAQTCSQEIDQLISAAVGDSPASTTAQLISAAESPTAPLTSAPQVKNSLANNNKNKNKPEDEPESNQEMSIVIVIVSVIILLMSCSSIIIIFSI